MFVAPMILFALVYLNHAFFLQMRGTGRPALRLAGRLHALGDAPAGGVPRPGPRGPGRVGRLPPDAGVRRPGLQPAGQGHHHDRPRRAGRAGISAVVRVGDVHLKRTLRAGGVVTTVLSSGKQIGVADFQRKCLAFFARFECQMSCNPIHRLPPFHCYYVLYH